MDPDPAGEEKPITDRLLNRREHSEAKSQPQAELTTDCTDATDKGNPSNPCNPWLTILAAGEQLGLLQYRERRAGKHILYVL
jgi:hypothetical protein